MWCELLQLKTLYKIYWWNSNNTNMANIRNWTLLEKNATEKCNVVCPKNNPCKIHSLLNVFTFFSEYIRTINAETNNIVSKILIEKNCEYKYCINRWCFEIYERKEPATRAKYLWVFSKILLYFSLKSTCFWFCLSVCTWQKDLNLLDFCQKNILVN